MLSMTAAEQVTPCAGICGYTQGMYTDTCVKATVAWVHNYRSQRSASFRIPGTDEELPLHGMVVVATMNPAVAGGGRVRLPRNVANKFTQVGLPTCHHVSALAEVAPDRHAPGQGVRTILQCQVLS
jgi:hypothetical protein